MSRTWESLGIDPSELRNPAGENKVRCPKCRPTAKDPTKRCLNVNTKTGEFNCWDNGEGCGFKGNLNAFTKPQGVAVSAKGHDGQAYRKITKEQYVQQTDPLPPEAFDWLHARGFTDDVITRIGLRWGAVTKDGDQWIKGIYFPYLVNRDGEQYIANIKKRCLCCKIHMQLAGRERGTDLPAELVLYGLTNVADTTIFCEGEPDAMAYWQAGITNAVSVPNGATLKSDTSRLSYLDACKPEIDTIKHAIMSLDDDQPGRLLKNEMARRLGFERCSYVVYPEGCKDANDVLLQYGADYLKLMIEQARPFPTVGISRPEDMLDQLLEWQQDGMPSGSSTGWKELDQYYRPVLGQLNIIVGIPSHGKSEFMDALLLNLWRHHGWRSLIFSPENYPPSTHMVKLAEKEIGKTFDPDVLAKWEKRGCPGELMTTEELERTVHTLQDGISFILPEIDGEGHTLDQLLEIARQEVYRTGIKVVILDPWNEIEMHIPRNMQKTDYIGLCLSKIRRFARHYNIIVFIIAHPTKLDRKPEKIKTDDGKEITIWVEPVPTAYDIADSAHWYNKADNVIAVWRDKHADVRGGNPNMNLVRVYKIKLKWAGEPGDVYFLWDPPTGRYLSLTSDDQVVVSPTIQMTMDDDPLKGAW